MSLSEDSQLLDGNDEICFVCRKPFTLLKRRHICRRCGRPLHLKCCELEQVKLPNPYSSPTLASVCPPCFTALGAIRRPLKDDIVAMHLSTRTTGYAYRGALLDTNEVAFASSDKTEWIRSTVCLIPPVDSPMKGSRTCVARTLPIINPPFALSSDKRRSTMISSILAFKHPCIGNLKLFEYLPERNSFMSVRQSYVRGSLKDMIYAVPLMKRFAQKRSYGLSRGRPLSPAGVARYGRHILEGLCYFKFFGFPYPYLHAGNVLLTKQGCVLADFENVIPGIPPATAASLANVRDPSLWEIVSFGLLLFEMATGRKPAKRLGSPISEAPEYVRETLKSIFPDGVVGGKSTRKPETTLEKLALGPLFGSVKSDLLDSIHKKENVFAGPIEKSVAVYFRKLTPALEEIIKAKCASESPEKGASEEKTKKKKAIKKEKKYHKSSGRVKEAPEPSKLSDIIKGKSTKGKEEEEEECIEKKEEEVKSGSEKEEDKKIGEKDDNVEKKKKKKENKEKKKGEDKKSSDSDSDSDSDSLGLSDGDDKDGTGLSDSDSDIDIFGDEKKEKREKKEKKEKKEIDKDEEARKFIEAYGFEQEEDDGSFDLFNEYEEPKEEEEEDQTKVVKREPRRVKI